LARTIPALHLLFESAAFQRDHGRFGHTQVKAVMVSQAAAMTLKAVIRDVSLPHAAGLDSGRPKKLFRF
jgi:hypothetical protein